MLLRLLAWLHSVLRELPTRCITIVLMIRNFHVGLEKINAELHKYRDRDAVGPYGVEGKDFNGIQYHVPFNRHGMAL
eukprot:3058735-Pyramimonas_sp.AAC.1